MRVAAIVLNWRGWADTLECLESLLRTDPAPALVVICDNDSRDGSVERIGAWGAGQVAAPRAVDRALRQLTEPPIPKPLEFTHVRAAAGGGDKGTQATWNAPAAPRSRLVLLETGGNLGYAGGNNVGIRYALGDNAIEAVWILNNDTVVTAGALGAMIRELDRDARAGFCGSTLLFYDRPTIVQTLGGAAYDPWLALPTHIGGGEPLVQAPPPERVRARLDYITGASMLVRREVIEEIGLMDESYFLYFEELDWAVRARGRYTAAYAPSSVVFHKEGRSIGTDGSRHKSEFADRWFHRNRLLITRRFFPRRLWTVRLALLVSVLRRAARGQWDRAGLVLRVLREG